jgi:hypothetical protein
VAIISNFTPIIKNVTVMAEYIHQWDETQFIARVENLSRNGFISRTALRSLMDNRFASPALKTTIHEMLTNNLSKQQLHLKYDLGIKNLRPAPILIWNEQEVVKQLNDLSDKQLYEKNDNRWTVVTVSRASLKQMVDDSRVSETHRRAISILMERNPSKKVFKPQEVESYLRKNL